MSEIDKNALLASDEPLSSLSANAPGRAARKATPLDLLFVLAAVLTFSFGWGRIVGIPAVFVVVALGVNTTEALVVSQVVLSIALPLPMIALLLFTGRTDIMGRFANGRLTAVAATIGTALVLLLNLVLILQSLGVPIPGLAAG